jgi:ubiquinone/menaquinone biosynthesis C-methylase UbiE
MHVQAHRACKASAILLALAGGLVFFWLQEIPNPSRALAELHRVLRPGGLLSITEEFTDPDYPLLSETIRLVEPAGYCLTERFGNWWVYTANFRRVP